MSPRELRAFRESLGLSRREFAPKIFISEPTLERWERGQGGPGELHLQILKRMREHHMVGRSIAYFQYDASSEAGIAQVRHEQKLMVIETIQGLGALTITEEASDSGKNWSVTFGMGWAVGEPEQFLLRCDGSELPERPAIDFTLEVTTKLEHSVHVRARLQDVCLHHRVFGEVTSREDGRSLITLGHRLFATGCNPETIAHVVGNFRSCWQRLKGKPSSQFGGRKSPEFARAREARAAEG